MLDQYAAAGAMDPVVFKNLEPVCKSEIEVQKVGYGTDADGKEVMLGPLAGWKVTVSRADGTMTPITKVTDGLGKAIFAGLPPGVYKVKETVQVGWEVKGDNPQTVIHRDCEKTPVRIENKEVQGKLKISGRKLFKAWVPPYKGTVVGLPGWVITATLVGTDVVTTTQTDALGNYVFPRGAVGAGRNGLPGRLDQGVRGRSRQLDPRDAGVCHDQVPVPRADELRRRRGELHQPAGSAGGSCRRGRYQRGGRLSGQYGGAQGPNTCPDRGQVWFVGGRAGEGEPHQESPTWSMPARRSACRKQPLR